MFQNLNPESLGEKDSLNENSLHDELDLCHLDVSKNSGFSLQIIHFNRVFHYKPSILGYPYFWKHPFESISDEFALTSISNKNCTWVKVDGATPTRWLSKGQWYINTCELRHLLSRSYVFFVLSKNGISLSPNHILGRFLPKHLFKETSKILQNSSITWQKWRDPKPIFPDDLDRTDPLFSLVKEVYHWRLSNPNTLVLLLLFLQPFNQKGKVGYLWESIRNIYTTCFPPMLLLYFGQYSWVPNCLLAVTFPSQGVTHETPPRQSWERYSSSPHVGGKGVGDLADLDLAASFEMIGWVVSPTKPPMNH